MRARPTRCSRRWACEAEEHGVEGGPRRLALLDDELPDWTSFIAANLLVDGVLATFVSACVDSTVEPMAQRARKILQEEGSHRVHAEAWARRLCRAGAASATRWWRACSRPGSTRAAGPAPPTTPTSAPPSSRACCATTPRSSASACARGWSTSCGAEGVPIALDEPTDWSHWDPELRRYEP